MTLSKSTAHCVMLLTLYSGSPYAANMPDYSSQPFELPAESEVLIVADTNGDGLRELITALENNIRIYFQTSDGFDFDSGFQEIELPGDAVGWDISANYNQQGNASIIALVDGVEVLVWQMEGNTILPPETIISGLPGFLSKGSNRLHFSRDINGDTVEDLIIPGAGKLHLYIANGDKQYRTGLSINSESRLRTNLDPGELERRTGQAISIPMMELRDVNSDGFDDLISRTDERLDVFIADQQAEAYFPASPSYTLDIAQIEERLGEFDIDNLDFSNLTGVLALTHEEILDDVDGDGIEDLLLREGSKVSLFGGTLDGMELEQPRQVLRSGGNVLSTFLYDENEDGLKDLWLWRVEPISVGDIFVWLALSGSIAIEAFIYPNEGERFSRRPSRKLTVDLQFPSVIRLATSFQKLADEARETQSSEVIPTSAANIDSDILNADLLVLINNQVNVFLNSIEPEDTDTEFLAGLDYSRQRDNYAINVREIIANISISENPQLARVEGQSADLIFNLDTVVENGDIIPVLLNNDARDDVFVFTGHSGSHIQGILLLSK
ncbi:MAG: hypothetical protein QGF90_07795 [Gammaproteobacteria bacterium]|nr:hypothetical protein [Gammaproteobacteria bacterium]